jgi:hypothetical protein
MTENGTGPRKPGAELINRLLADARKRLIEIGTRNRLVHTSRTAKRPSTLAVVQRDSDALFNALARDTQTLRFRADPRLAGREDEPESPPPPADDLLLIDSAGLQTRLGPEALQKRLLKFARDAKTLEEEQGINILYLAVGFLRWYEDDGSNVLREAPLILVPVSLVRDVRRSTFDLRAREDDISTNLPLCERLKEFGITLPEIPEDDEWLPSGYFQAVEQAIMAKRRWSIDRDGVELGLFSFAKLLMFHDLAGENWPDETILDHPLLRALLTDGFEVEAPLFPDDLKLDQKFAPADLFQVVDADGSQTLAIETARAGRNLVIQGPPGTGKSQTIANIIAGAAYDGKSVLFVAEKMVALDVVYDRLKKAGIASCCLELHSRAANKRLISEELGKTIDRGAAVPNVAAEATKLQSIRDRLNEIAAHLHRPVQNSGKTPIELIGRLAYAAGKNEKPPEISLSDDLCCDASAFSAFELTVTRLVAVMGTAGPISAHIWRGIGNIDLQPMDLQRLDRTISTLCEAIKGLLALAAEGAQILELPPPSTLSEIAHFASILEIVQALPVQHGAAIERLAALSTPDLKTAADLAQAGLDLQTALAREQKLFVTSAFQCDAIQLRAKLARGSASWLARWGSDYRSASAELGSYLTTPLPKSAPERVALVDRLIAVKEQRRIFAERGLAGAPLLGGLWAAEHTDFRALLDAYLWLLRAMEVEIVSKLTNVLFVASKESMAQLLLERIKSSAASLKTELNTLFQSLDFNCQQAFATPSIDTVPLSAVAERFATWSQSHAKYSDWAELSRLDRELRLLAADIANRLADGRLSPATALAEITCARAEILFNLALKEQPQLRKIATENRNALVSEFKTLERARRESVAALVRARHAEGMPRGVLGDMGIIRGEIARRRGHMPIRKLMARAGRTLQKIKPVFMMSPISVAQYLPPGSVSFDLIVIDEASQVRPEDALGVIARGGQMVVVGDKKQLPPTTFFSRLLEDSEEKEDDDAEAPSQTPLAGAARVSELESILTLAEARGVGSKMLRWHYRSRHPSLIEVSNAEFYVNNLFLPPSPNSGRDAEGLVLRRVAGAYDRGGKRTNAIEGRAIVEALSIHAAEKPELSLGIVAFSTAQRDLISDLVDQRRTSDPALDAFLTEGHSEECFIKNLENVQGDERDVILISVGYGPRTAGARLETMNFGPVSSEGGERRLNVLFTRARRRTEVFCSFNPGDIDLERARGEGPRVLQRFLRYAESGVLDQPQVSGDDYDSFFEQDVANVVRALGFAVDAQVGSAGFKIDLGVRDPESPSRYIAAIECDGATYHHALWARERDRLRQDVLENMGWRFYRIWSTDWFYRRFAEIERLGKFLNTARTKPPTPPQRPAPLHPPANDQPIIVPTQTSPAYRTAQIDIRHRGDPHEVSAHAMSEIVGKIIEAEGPIHLDEIARRVATLWGKERTGNRIAQAVADGINSLRRANKTIRRDGDFFFTSRQEEDCPIRDRSAASVSLQKAEMLPPLEIRAAAFRAIEENGAIGKDEIATAVTRMLGFQRTGPDLRAKVEREIGAMLRAGRLAEQGGRLQRPASGARSPGVH